MPVTNVEAELARLCDVERSHLVEDSGITYDLAAMAVKRALGNARSALRGIPEHLYDEAIVAKTRYELAGCAAWAQSYIASLER